MTSKLDKEIIPQNRQRLGLEVNIGPNARARFAQHYKPMSGMS